MISGTLYHYYQTVPAGKKLWEKIEDAIGVIFETRKTPMRRAKLIKAIVQEVRAHYTVNSGEMLSMSAFEIIEMMAESGQVKKSMQKGKAFIFKR